MCKWLTPLYTLAIVIWTFTLAITPPTLAQQPCENHLLHGLPTGGNPANQLIERENYCLSLNPQTKFADWVAYRLDAETVTGEMECFRGFAADPDVPPENILELSDYEGAYKELGLDRGHLAPLSSFRGEDTRSINLMSNIVPQSVGLNRGVWRLLEDWERVLTLAHSPAYVITGTVYQENRLQLPNADEEHKIPTGFWKLIEINNEITAYYFPQSVELGLPIESGRVPLVKIESMTGLKFNRE